MKVLPVPHNEIYIIGTHEFTNKSSELNGLWATLKFGFNK